MEKKKIIFCLIKALSEVDRIAYKQKIKCGKTAKNAERHEKLFGFFEKAVESNNVDDIQTPKLVKTLKLPSHKRLTPIYAELIEGLKKFLINSELQEQDLQQQMLLQKALCRREENQYIEVLHQEIREQIADIKIPSPKEYQYQASFYKSLYLHPNTDSRKEEALVYLKHSEINLDTSYWIRKLRLLIEKANRGIIIANESYLLNELPQLPNLTEYTYNKESHILSIYASVYEFVLTPFQEEDLEKVLTLITEHSAIIPKEDKERIFNYLMGIIPHYLSGKKTNLTDYDVYKVYKLGFTKLWLIQDDGFIYFEDFVNIAYLAFFYKDHQLLESLELDYLQYIPRGYQPFVSMQSRAYNFFLHKRWEDVLKAFSNQELPNKGHRLHFIVQRNLLEIQSLFEAFVHDKIELEDIPSYLEKHSRFIQRKSNVCSELLKTRNLRFIKILKKLYSYLNKRVTFNFDKTEARKYLEEWLSDLEKTGKGTIDQVWLQSIGKRLLQEVQVTA
jgi:hypothetical protein